jgi:hypothetical protein
MGMMSLGSVCDTTEVVISDGGGDGQVDGTDPNNGGGSDPGEEPNPNSSCEDQTDIYVSYVNESSARVGFVENFRDQAYNSLSASIHLLRAAGDPDAAKDKCITCPWQAGVRNITYIQDGESIKVTPPPDLYRGDFKCGDNITFVFKADMTVVTSVATP